MINPGAVAAYRRALAIRGEQVTVTRNIGYAPAVTSVTATVQAIVMNYTPDTIAAERTGVGSSEPGGITQGDRMIILMAVDLQLANYPLPMTKDDQITLTASTGDTLNVTKVDMSKRAFAGAIELLAGGTA